MGVVLLPVARLRGQVSERAALQQGVALAVPMPALHVVPKGAPEGPVYCARCAAPIEYGAVLHGQDSYCSVECSLGGDRPA